MIITRAPFRISFVGGGTDLREFYSIEDGQVLSTSIDKYIYVLAKKQSNIAEYKYRINWSKVEFSNSIDDIEHPIVRESLRYLNINFPVEISTFADIPAQSGLGSSSSFGVALLKNLIALKGEEYSDEDIARIAAEIEVDILKRNMGKQDHYAAAIGGFNKIIFKGNEETLIEKLQVSDSILQKLSDNLMLFFTSQTRDASKILKSQSENTKNKFNELKRMKDLVPTAANFISNSEFSEFAELMNENWHLKRMLTKDISNSFIDECYKLALESGAKGGKLLGAGGGGFLCFYVEKDKQESVRNALKTLHEVEFNFAKEGVKLLYKL
jgi:D-glycero-alpha-D-manno-heptose-7-phosphate kinase